MRRRFLLAFLFVAASCNADNTKTPASSITAAPTTQAPSTTTRPAPECEPVSAPMVAEIASGLKAGGASGLGAAHAVKAPSPVDMYLIAADLYGPGLDGPDDIAVWASHTLDPGRGLIDSVESRAMEFSSWNARDAGAGAGRDPADRSPPSVEVVITLQAARRASACACHAAGQAAECAARK